MNRCSMSFLGEHLELTSKYFILNFYDSLRALSWIETRVVKRSSPAVSPISRRGIPRSDLLPTIMLASFISGCSYLLREPIQIGSDDIFHVFELFDDVLVAIFLIVRKDEHDPIDFFKRFEIDFDHFCDIWVGSEWYFVCLRKGAGIWSV
jgi:hypothetical protein